MLISLAFIFLSIGLITLSVLNSFLVTQTNLLENYISANQDFFANYTLQKNAELLLNIHGNCLNFSGGWSGNSNFGSFADYDPNGMSKKIFPYKVFVWKIENLLDNYSGKLNFNDFQIFLQSKSVNEINEYSGSKAVIIIPKIKIKFQLPSEIADKLSDPSLNVNQDINGDGVSDDEVVYWKVSGENVDLGKFKIIPISEILDINGTLQRNNSKDNFFTENDVNLNLNIGNFDLEFSNDLANLYNPILVKTENSLLTGHNLFSEIYDSGYYTTGFENIFSSFTGEIFFQIINPLLSNSNIFYPYLNLEIVSDKKICIPQKIKVYLQKN